MEIIKSKNFINNGVWKIGLYRGVRKDGKVEVEKYKGEIKEMRCEME